jgi:hypothetical protein
MTLGSEPHIPHEVVVDTEVEEKGYSVSTRITPLEIRLEVSSFLM